MTDTTSTTTTTTEITDIHKIRKLQERYPFTEEELEILVRCHDHIQNQQDKDDFLLKLARASPYQYFFLPGDEMHDRVTFIEEQVLPPGFCNELKVATISGDAFVEYANQGQDKQLERFLEGIADGTGRRGTKETLRLLYRLIDEPKPEELMDICIRLVVATESLTIPNLNKEDILRKIEDYKLTGQMMTESLNRTCLQNGKLLSCQIFIDWVEEYFPMVGTPLSTFLHGLLFHGHAYPKTKIPYIQPKLDTTSNIFPEINSASLLALSMTSQSFGGKWHRIYSSFYEGRSFNRLEYALLGYNGPTVIVIKTTAQQILGAYASVEWKESKHFFGNAECFLFELQPNLMIYHADGKETNYMYLHSDHEDHANPTLCHGHLHGLAFGGDMNHPRFFIPESFENCTATYFDKTYKSGELLPIESLEKFEIQVLEVWGVGGDEVIEKATKHREEYRVRCNDMIERARSVHYKGQFNDDMQTGLIPTMLYGHQKDVRGSPKSTRQVKGH